MAKQRDRVRMTTEEVGAFLRETHTMAVATLNPDGQPHVVAMWYGFLDGKPGLVFCTLLSFYDFLAWANVYERRVAGESRLLPRAR